MTHVLSWFHVPDEEGALIAYLAKSGRLWAFAWHVDPGAPEHPPAPIAEFFRDHGDALTRGFQATSARWAEENAAYWKDPTAARPNPSDWGQPKNHVYLGLREAVTSPRMHALERLEGGVIEPGDQPGTGRIVGGAHVRRRTLDHDNELLRYERATWQPHRESVEGPHLSYESGAAGDDFLRLGKQAFGWIRRWTPCSVDVHNARFARRATERAAAEAGRGMRFS
jgi:hypothetical protein